jgi:hypothetical protein
MLGFGGNIGDVPLGENVAAASRKARTSGATGSRSGVINPTL